MRSRRYRRLLRRRAADRGWTLIELLVVISLVMILASLALTQYRNAVRSAKEAALRSDLTASGKIANATLECPPNACSVGDIADSQLLGKAKEAGATHLLIGRFHKMSTLIQQAKFDVIDVKARKIVFDRYISFRGDNDAAWRRAESFLARQILDHGEW